MLNYKELRKEFKKVLSNIDNTEIEDWLKFDEERIANENFINGEKVTIKVEKITKKCFNNLNSSISIDTDEFNIAA